MSRLQKDDGAGGAAPRTIDDIAREQGINAPQELDRMIGSAANLWENDEEFESFVQGIHTRRREGLAAETRKAAGESQA
ncbi:MAG TPA: hypothetical protein VLI90_03270 [Tepidisphaeraceae bacterium]|nr:hypothetical protein [Tepidisphaeraceae bacterium]